MDGLAGRVGVFCWPLAALEDSGWLQGLEDHETVVPAGFPGNGVIAVAQPSHEEMCVACLYNLQCSSGAWVYCLFLSLFRKKSGDRHMLMSSSSQNPTSPFVSNITGLFYCLAVPPFGLGRSPERGHATHSSILAWRIPWTEEPGRQQSMGSKRIRRD